jgi:hypothetical protein
MILADREEELKELMNQSSEFNLMNRESMVQRYQKNNEMLEEAKWKSDPYYKQMMEKLQEQEK